MALRSCRLCGYRIGTSNALISALVFGSANSTVHWYCRQREMAAQQTQFFLESAITGGGEETGYAGGFDGGF